jgi:ArsR family transcriptional regulator
MDDAQVIAALAALAQPTRLNTFKLLVAHEREGIPAGELARLAEVPQNTMSAHRAVLARAGLITGERQSRSIIYRADLQQFRDVTLFLLKDCCGGKPEICASLIADLTPCCPPPKPNQPEVMWRVPHPPLNTFQMGKQQLSKDVDVRSRRAHDGGLDGSTLRRRRLRDTKRSRRNTDRELAMPFRDIAGILTSEDLAVAHAAFDKARQALEVPADAAQRRDEIAYEIMSLLTAGDRDVVSISEKVLEKLRG